MRYVLVTIFLCLFQEQTAFAIGKIKINEEFSQSKVFPFQYLTDQENELDIAAVHSDDLAWKNAESPSLNFGFTDASYWVRFTIHQDADSHETIFLEIDYPLHDHLNLYLPDETGHYELTRTGDSLPFDNRPIKDRKFIFQLNTSQIDGRPVYIKIRSGSSMRIGMSLLTSASLIEKNQTETAIFFLFYGTMAAMILYNLLLFFSIGEKPYIHYVFYILSHSLFQMALNGHLFQYVLPNYPGLAAKSIPLFVGTTCIGIGLFTRSFLDTSRFVPTINKLLIAIVAAGCIIIVLNFYLSYGSIISWAAGVSFTFPWVLFAAGFRRYTQGYKPAGIYLIAFTVFFLGVVLGASLTLGLMPSNVFTEYGAQIGASFEVILLSIALGSKFNIERKQRYEAQNNALLAAKEKEHSYDQMSKVVYPHQVNLIQQGHSIEETMPTGVSEACVLAFDIINSSNVNNEGFTDLMEEFMDECRELMMVGYDGDTLKSNAYMIKEMGDGFLCSVGYPFKQIGESKAKCAVELAKEIIGKFERLNQHLNSPFPVHCCIGVAMGQVNAYFSKSGSIRHDLWGPAIVLATRYEATRKEIFKRLKFGPCNLIIVQELVYNSLSSQMRADFEVHSLEKLDLKVRDDSEAKHLIFAKM